MALSPEQVRKRAMAAAKSSGMQLAELSLLLRTHFPRGTKSFRWVNDLFGGQEVGVLGGDERAFGVFVTALKSPSDASFKKAQAALEKGAGGKPTAAPRPRPTAPKPRPTAPKPPKAPKPPSGKAQYIKPRLGAAGSTAGAATAKKRWDAAIDRGADPIEATRRRIGATADKSKLAGIVIMLNAITPKAGKKPTRAQIKSLAEAAEKKAGFKPTPSTKPPKKPPTKPPKPAVIKKVKAAQRVDLAKFPLLGANWNSKVSTKSPVDNFTRSALRMRSKDKLQEAISLLKTVGSGAKGKERSVFQGAVKLIKDRLKAVSPRATVPGKKPEAALAGKPSAKPPKKPKKAGKSKFRWGSDTTGGKEVALSKRRWDAAVRRGADPVAATISRIKATKDDKKLDGIMGMVGDLDISTNFTKGPGDTLEMWRLLHEKGVVEGVKRKKKKAAPKKAAPKRVARPTRRRAVAHAAKRMGVEAALRRGLKRGEKVQVQLDLTFTEV